MMGGEITYRKGYERGPYYEIKCIQEVIIGKAARGENATFERDLLKSWAEYPGWEMAREVLPPARSPNKSKSRSIKR